MGGKLHRDRVEGNGTMVTHTATYPKFVFWGTAASLKVQRPCARQSNLKGKGSRYFKLLDDRRSTY